MISIIFLLFSFSLRRLHHHRRRSYSFVFWCVEENYLFSNSTQIQCNLFYLKEKPTFYVWYVLYCVHVLCGCNYSKRGTTEKIRTKRIILKKLILNFVFFRQTFMALRHPRRNSCIIILLLCIFWVYVCMVYASLDKKKK